MEFGKWQKALVGLLLVLYTTPPLALQPVSELCVNSCNIWVNSTLEAELCDVNLTTDGASCQNVTTNIEWAKGSSTSIPLPTIHDITTDYNTSQHIVTWQLTQLSPAFIRDEHEYVAVQQVAAEENSVNQCAFYQSNPSNQMNPVNTPQLTFGFQFCLPSSPSNQQQSFNLFLVDIQQQTTVPYSVTIPQLTQSDEWSALTAVSVNLSNRTVTAFLGEAPAELNITAYDIRLIFQDTSIIVGEVDGVSPNTSSHTFTDIAGHSKSQFCLLRVLLHSVTCNTGACITGFSATFLLPADLDSRGTSSTPVESSSTTFSSATNMTINSLPTEPTDSSIVVKPAETDNDDKIKVIVGTVFGVLAVAGIILLIWCLHRRNVINLPGGFQMHRLGLTHDSSSDESGPSKKDPTVLLLYSYDCYTHEKVVIAFANYLKFVGNCSVAFDIWDQHTVHEQGMKNWIQEKVQTCQFIFIICSTGARFQCARNRQFKLKDRRAVPDNFAWAVEHVMEKYRGDRDKGSDRGGGETATKFVIINFDYVSESDIPPKIDSMPRFYLMEDIYKLYCLLHNVKAEEQGAVPGMTYESYSHVDYGKAFHEALDEARDFLKSNPSWLDQALEPITSNDDTKDEQTSTLKSSSKRHQKRGSTQMLITESEDIATEDSMEEEDKPDEKQSNDRHKDTPPSSKTSLVSNGPMSKSQQSNGVVTRQQNARKNGFPAADSDAMETIDLQKDLDFIQNFDAHHVINADLDLGGYTPPEEFISLASVEEEIAKSRIKSSQNSHQRPETSHFVLDFVNPSIKSVITENNNLEKYDVI